MDKLTEFYIALAQDAQKMQRFNAGNAQADVLRNRQQMLEEFGVAEAANVVKLDEIQLKAKMTELLSSQAQQWSNVSSLSPNTTNNDNRVSSIGRTNI